jgi:hypothetical protein
MALDSIYHYLKIKNNDDDGDEHINLLSESNIIMLVFLILKKILVSLYYNSETYKKRYKDNYCSNLSNQFKFLQNFEP